MGMFDSIYVYGADRERLPCAVGHLLDSEWQTKDLDESMNTYLIHNNILWIKERSHVEGVIDGEFEVIKIPLRLTDLTDTLRIYTSCEVCDPVVFDRQTAGWGGRVDERKPWIEYIVQFNRGIVVDIQPVKLETREIIKDRLRKEGLLVLDDDDRIAKKTIEDHHKRRTQHGT